MASVTRARIIASLNGGRARGRAVPEFRAVGQRHLLEQRRRLSVPQRRDDHRDLVAGFEDVEFPPGTIEDARSRALDQPPFRLTARRLLPVELDVDVWIGPLELRDDAHQLDLFTGLVGRKRM